MHDAPAPVLNDDGLTVATWDTLEQARKETAGMPISADRDAALNKLQGVPA